jgi:hypothetical protein
MHDMEANGDDDDGDDDDGELMICHLASKLLRKIMDS